MADSDVVPILWAPAQSRRPRGANYFDVDPETGWTILEHMIRKLQAVRDLVGVDRWDFPFIGTSTAANLLGAVCDGELDTGAHFVEQPIFKGQYGQDKSFWRLYGRYELDTPTRHFLVTFSDATKLIFDSEGNATEIPPDGVSDFCHLFEGENAEIWHASVFTLADLVAWVRDNLGLELELRGAYGVHHTESLYAPGGVDEFRWRVMPAVRRHALNVSWVIVNELMQAIERTFGLTVGDPGACIFRRVINGLGSAGNESELVNLARVHSFPFPGEPPLGFEGNLWPAYREKPPRPVIGATPFVASPDGAEETLRIERSLVEQMEVIEGTPLVGFPDKIAGTQGFGEGYNKGIYGPPSWDPNLLMDAIPSGPRPEITDRDAIRTGGPGVVVWPYPRNAIGQPTTKHHFRYSREVFVNRVRADNVNADVLQVRYRIRYRWTQKVTVVNPPTAQVSLYKIDHATWRWYRAWGAGISNATEFAPDGKKYPYTDFDFDYAAANGTPMHINMVENQWYEGTLDLPRVAYWDRYMPETWPSGHERDHMDPAFYHPGSQVFWLNDAFTALVVQPVWSTDPEDYRSPTTGAYLPGTLLGFTLEQSVSALPGACGF